MSSLVVISYGGGEFLSNVFNSIAMIFHNGGFNSVMNSAALIGLMGMLASAAFMKSKISYQWFLGLVVLQVGLINTKATVIISDKIYGGQIRTVDNVPIGIALPASLISTLGDYLTEKTETVFSLPYKSLNYRGNGLLFSETLIDESSHMQVSNPINAANLSSYWKNCVMYGLALNHFSWENLVKSSDILNFLSSVSSSTLFFEYEKSGAKAPISCNEGIKFLNDDLEVETDTALTKLGGMYFKGSKENITEYKANLAQSIVDGYQYFANISTTAANVLKQHIVMNSFKNGIIGFAGATNSAAALQSYAIAKSDSERSTIFNTTFYLSRRSMPILQQVLEAMIYALFPIMVVFTIIAGTGVLKKYIQAMAWVQLWPVLYAILNYAMAFYSQKASIMSGGEDHALSLIASGQVGTVFSEYVMTAGMLSMSIPMISWLIVSGSSHMMSSIAERALSSYESTGASAAREAATGNISMGQVGYMNHTAFQQNSAPSNRYGSSTVDNGSGMVTQTLADGTTFTRDSTGAYNLRIGTALSKSAKEQVSLARTNTESAAQTYDESYRATFNNVSNQMKDMSRGVESSDSVSHRNSLDSTHGSGNNMTAVENADFKTGIDASLKFLGNGVNGGATFGSNNSDQESAFKDFKKGIGDAKEFLSRHSEHFKESNATGIQDQMSELVGKAENFAETWSKQIGAQKTEDKVASMSESLDLNGTNILRNEAKRQGIDDHEFNQILSSATNFGNTAATEKLQGLSQSYAKNSLGVDVDISELNGISFGGHDHQLSNSGNHIRSTLDASETTYAARRRGSDEAIKQVWQNSEKIYGNMENEAQHREAEADIETKYENTHDKVRGLMPSTYVNKMSQAVNDNIIHRERITGEEKTDEARSNYKDQLN